MACSNSLVTTSLELNPTIDSKAVLFFALGVIMLLGLFASFIGHPTFLPRVTLVLILGATIANPARYHDYPFHAIKGIEEQFLMLLLVLAGASLEIEIVVEIDMLGILFIGLRSIGEVLRTRFGGNLADAD